MVHDDPEFVILPPICPRCRYDLRGATAAWNEQCDLRGRCPECGYEFQWADVLRGDRQLPRWSIEYARSRRERVLAVLATTCAVLIPPLYLGRVRLWMPIRLRRVAAWVLCLLLVPHVLVALIGATNNAYALIAPARASRYAPWVPQPSGWFESASSVVYPFLSPLVRFGMTSPAAVNPPVWRWAWLWAFDWILPVVWHVLLASATWPLMLAMLRVSRRISGVARIHIVRASLYALLPTLLLWIVRECEVAQLHIAYGYLSGHFVGAMSRGRGLVSLLDRADWYTGGWNIEVTTEWSLASLVFACLSTLWQGWWWYQVVVHHWEIRHGRLVWSLLLIVMSLVLGLIAVGPVAFHYIWLNRGSGA